MPAALSWWRISLLALGFGCMVGFARMASLGFGGYVHQGVISSVDEWYGVRAAATVIVLALLASAGWFKWFRVGRAMLAGAVVFGCAAVLLVAFGDGRFGPGIAVLGGVSSAVLMYTWMLLLSSRSVAEIVAAVVGGLVVAGAIIAGVPRLDSAIGLAIILLSVIAAGAIAIVSDGRLGSCAPDGRPSRSELSRVPWLPVIMLLAAGFFSTVLYGIAEHLTWLYDWNPNYVAFGIAIVAVPAATFVIMLRARNWMRIVWIPSIVLLACAACFACFSIREAVQLAVGLALAAVFCGHCLHWAVVSAMFSATGVSRSFLAGIFLIVANGSFAAMAGSAIGAALPHSMQNLGGVTGIMVLALVVVFTVASGIDRKVRGRIAGGSESDAGFSDAPSGQEGTVANPADAARACIESLATEHGLTPREQEVALFTLQGFSAAYIAEKLVVSNSTVRFHQQNLYRKLDVHSRNEFIELVVRDDGEVAEPDGRSVLA